MRRIQSQGLGVLAIVTGVSGCATLCPPPLITEWSELDRVQGEKVVVPSKMLRALLRNDRKLEQERQDLEKELNELKKVDLEK